MTYKKKLIEMALPLPEINDASAYGNSGDWTASQGYPPLVGPAAVATERAVLFASVVDDPSEHPEKWPTEAAQNAERERLFGIIRRMCSSGGRA